MKIYVPEWDKLKDINGVWGPYYEDSKEYNVIKIDGNVEYNNVLKKADWDQEGTNTKDFYDNVKPEIDDGMYVFDPRSDDCVPTIYQTHRPFTSNEYTTYFCGSGDDPVNGIGEGTILNFNLTNQDAVIQKDLTFNEDIYIKDGHFICENAPFGAYFDVEIIHPTLGLLGVFCKKCPILGTFQIPLNTEDRALIPVGIILRVNVYNSVVAQDFKITGRLELYRKTTV